MTVTMTVTKELGTMPLLKPKETYITSVWRLTLISQANVLENELERT